MLVYRLWKCYCYVCNVSGKAKGCDYFVMQLPKEQSILLRLQ